MRSKKKYLQKQIDELYQKVYQPSRSYVDLRAIVLDDKVYEAVIVGSTEGLDDNPEWSWLVARGEAPPTLEVDARDIARGRYGPFRVETHSRPSLQETTYLAYYDPR